MKLLRGFAAIIIATSLFSLNSSVPAEPVKLSESITSNKLTSDNIDASENILRSTINTNVSTIPTAPNNTISKNTTISANIPALSSTVISQNSTSKQQVSSTQNNSSASASAAQTPSSSAKQADVVSTPPASPQLQQPAAEAPKPGPIVETPKPAPPSNPSSDKLILGYGTYYSSKDVSSLNSLKAHSSLIDELATHTYIVDTTGGLYIQGNVFPTSQVSFANSNGIKTLAVVRNEFNGELAHDILSSSTSTNNLINSIEKSLAANNYKGVNIDFELLYSKDRDSFTNFMRDLYNKLHPKGYIVSIALPAKTSESEKWVYAYDYAKLGSYSDQVILMTYDEHYPGGAPGPVASLNWTQRVVNYAASVIPKSKLLLGVAAYGYDWTVKDGKTISTKSLSISSAYSTASANGAQILWDNIAQVPYYNYTDSKGSHSVYFENGTSISYKLNIVNNSNLKGIAIWRLGLEDESYWTTIKTKLNK